jgi:hypothetical protein
MSTSSIKVLISGSFVLVQSCVHSNLSKTLLSSSHVALRIGCQDGEPGFETRLLLHDRAHGLGYACLSHHELEVFFSCLKYNCQQ